MGRYEISKRMEDKGFGTFPELENIARDVKFYSESVIYRDKPIAYYVMKSRDTEKTWIRFHPDVIPHPIKISEVDLPDGATNVRMITYNGRSLWFNYKDIEFEVEYNS